MESGEKAINDTTKLTIIEDKVYRILRLPHRTLYQVFVPVTAPSALASLP